MVRFDVSVCQVSRRDHLTKRSLSSKVKCINLNKNWIIQKLVEYSDMLVIEKIALTDEKWIGFLNFVF